MVVIDDLQYSGVSVCIENIKVGTMRKNVIICPTFLTCTQLKTVQTQYIYNVLAQQRH